MSFDRANIGATAMRNGYNTQLSGALANSVTIARPIPPDSSAPLNFERAEYSESATTPAVVPKTAMGSQLRRTPVAPCSAWEARTSATPSLWSESIVSMTHDAMTRRALEPELWNITSQMMLVVRTVACARTNL